MADVFKIKSNEPIKTGSAFVLTKNSGGQTVECEFVTDAQLAAFNSVIDTRFDESNYYWGTVTPDPDPDPDPSDNGLQAVSGLTGQLRFDSLLVADYNWELNSPVEPDGYLLEVFTNSDYTTGLYGDDWYAAGTSSATTSESFEPYTTYYLKMTPYNTASGNYLDIYAPGSEFGEASTYVIALFMQYISGFSLTVDSIIEPYSIAVSYDYPSTWPGGLTLSLEWALTSNFSGTVDSLEIESGTYSELIDSFNSNPLEPYTIYYCRIKAVLGVESSEYAYDDIAVMPQQEIGTPGVGNTFASLPLTELSSRPTSWEYRFHEGAGGQAYDVSDDHYYAGTLDSSNLLTLANQAQWATIYANNFAIWYLDDFEEPPTPNLGVDVGVSVGTLSANTQYSFSIRAVVGSHTSDWTETTFTTSNE